MTEAIRIDSDFPGGNIVVEDIAGDEVRLHQDLRDTHFDWFYWCFRVSGAHGRKLRFVFTKSLALGVRGPAISFDSGRTWQWLGRETLRDENIFEYVFPNDAVEARLSFAMPYQESNWRDFINSLENRGVFSLHKLCITSKGRDVEYMRLDCRKKNPKHRIVFTSRHHCCEMMANYVLEGALRWLLDSRAPEARWLRDNADILIIPFVDKDGVEDGDQGKGRNPRDHARDYEGKSIYSSVAAIRELLPEWGAGRLHVGIDLHCPWISGECNEYIYQVGSPHQRNAEEQKCFSNIIESVCSGPLPFAAADYLPFGQEWNKEANYKEGMTFSRWLAQQPGIVLATSFEIPYANVKGRGVNRESASMFGRDLGMALSEYMKTIDT